MSSSSAEDGQRRPAHLVGSIPAPDASAAMAMAGQLLGERLRWLPDGETGDRHHWVMGFIERLREHPDLEVVDDGDWSDYDSTPRFRVRSGHRLRASRWSSAISRHSRPAFRSSSARRRRRAMRA